MAKLLFIPLLFIWVITRTKITKNVLFTLKVDSGKTSTLTTKITDFYYKQKLHHKVKLLIVLTSKTFRVINYLWIHYLKKTELLIACRRIKRLFLIFRTKLQLTRVISGGTFWKINVRFKRNLFYLLLKLI